MKLSQAVFCLVIIIVAAFTYVGIAQTTSTRVVAKGIPKTEIEWMYEDDYLPKGNILDHSEITESTVTEETNEV